MLVMDSMGESAWWIYIYGRCVCAKLLVIAKTQELFW